MIETHVQVTTINNIGSTGIFPSDIKTAILTPLQKPGKKRGPISNIRPLMLMSIIRKIIAICLVNRTFKTISTYIPTSQSAYQPGRSTTEHVFALKTLIERAISFRDESINIMLLDMSAAFDTVNRSTLLSDLSKILGPDILFLAAILVNDTSVKVRNGKCFSRTFNTNVGVAQGDCYSAILFIFYLACSLVTNNIETIKAETAKHDHDYSMPHDHFSQHHPYIEPEKKAEKVNYIALDEQYADDLGWIDEDKGNLNNIKTKITARLKTRNLSINASKTEEFEVSREGNDSWKSCKFLGSLLDTECDIKRRKSLSLVAFAKLKDVFKHKKISRNSKIRVFNVYVKSVFMYNSELWTLSKKLENDIDIFQRRLLRQILKIHYPDIISNENLYKKAKQKPWSDIIRKRRLSWIGHLLRLPENTPARQALKTYLNPAKRPQGRPKLNWVTQVQKDLKNIRSALKIEDPNTYFIATNRKEWRKTVNSGNNSAVSNILTV